MTRLELLRIIHGYKQRQLELMVGCSRGTIERYENGVPPKKITRTMQRLGDILDVSPKDLFKQVKRGDVI